MKFALSDEGIKIEATKGARGICPICKETVIAKCGTKNAHHWAHLSGKDCDPWSSPETKWHLNWKNKFPLEWQERTCKKASSPEIHRADVKTDSGLVLEFQHSNIEEQDKQARERFYEDMFWVVDLSKKIDRKKLLQAKLVNNKDTYNRLICINATEVFPLEWFNRKTIVIFDYLGLEEQIEGSVYNDLFCIIPTIGKKSYAYLLILNRNKFVEEIRNNSFNIFIKKYTKDLNDILLAEQMLLTGKIKITRQPNIHQNRKISRKFRF